VQGGSDRSFGFVFAGVFLVIAVYPLFFGQAFRAWSLGVALVFAIVALIAPSILGPLNRAWARFGLLLHTIVSPVALALMFFVVITPMALIMRVLGKDLLRLRWDRDATTYWIEREPPGPAPESLRDQF
jgi:hypothetical protein